MICDDKGRIRAFDHASWDLHMIGTNKSRIRASHYTPRKLQVTATYINLHFANGTWKKVIFLFIVLYAKFIDWFSCYGLSTYSRSFKAIMLTCSILLRCIISFEGEYNTFCFIAMVFIGFDYDIYFYYYNGLHNVSYR